jgi:hypothetical protein
LPETGGFTVIVTVEGGLAAPALSVTMSENVSVAAAATCGAGKVGCATLVLDSVTVGDPAVWVQAYEAMVPSESVLDEPLSVTVAPEETL